MKENRGYDAGRQFNIEDNGEAKNDVGLHVCEQVEQQRILGPL